VNSKQKVFVLIGMLGLITIFIFPPWETHARRSPSGAEFLGFSFIGSPPEPGSGRSKPNLAHSTIAIEILILIAISVGGVLLMKETASTNSTNETSIPTNKSMHDTTTPTSRRMDTPSQPENAIEEDKDYIGAFLGGVIIIVAVVMITLKLIASSN
jgi:hypothetical protein